MAPYGTYGVRPLFLCCPWSGSRAEFGVLSTQRELHELLHSM